MSLPAASRMPLMRFSSQTVEPSLRQVFQLEGHAALRIGHGFPFQIQLLEECLLSAAKGLRRHERIRTEVPGVPPA